MARVTLRALREEDFGRLWQERLAECERSGRPLGPGSRRRLEALVRRSPRLVNGRLDLAVEAGGRLVGHVEARQPKQALPPGVFEIGIELFAEARGRGFGQEAVRLLAEHLFEEHDAHRVQASTWVENAPMRRVLERLGWAYEGVLRAFMRRSDGGLDDYALYAITRADRAPAHGP